MRQLPTEARRFNSVDQLWKKVRSLAVPDDGYTEEGLYLSMSSSCGTSRPRIFCSKFLLVDCVGL